MMVVVFRSKQAPQREWGDKFYSEYGVQVCDLVRPSGPGPATQ